MFVQRMLVAILRLKLDLNAREMEKLSRQTLGLLS